MADKPASKTEVVQFSTSRYIYVLICLVLLIISVITVTIYWQLNKSNRVERTANNYHLFTMMNCIQIQQELHHIESYVHERSERERIYWEYESGDIINLTTSFLIIKDKLTAIKELQHRYAHREYESVLNNADNMLSRLLTMQSKNELNADADLKDSYKIFSQLSIFLEQLQRLHANTYNEITSELIIERPKAFRNIFLSLSIPVIIGILLIKKILNLIRSEESELERHRLNLQKMVEERTRELSETNENLIQEVTQRRQIENELIDATKEIEKWNLELEARVKEKTAELEKSHNLLIQSEKLSAMGKMTGGIAHELNSPLAGLVPMLEIYKKRELEGSKESKEVDLMLKAALHMAKIVKDFGVFSRKSKSEFRALSLNEVIEDTLSFSEVRLRQKGVKVKKELSGRLPLILGDKTELQQVVLNMITNAVDAMNEGDDYLITTDVSEDNNQVIMSFIDSGVGIAKENLNKIFDPFFTTKKEGEGTGLGLSVSYGIIKNHNGEITVERKPGKGTKFSIYLPAVNKNNT